MRTHRVGTITFGVTLIACGVLFLISQFSHAFSLETVLSFWPVVLIALGVEVLVGYAITHSGKATFKFDWLGMVFTALTVLFSMGMAFCYVIITHSDIWRTIF